MSKKKLPDKKSLYFPFFGDKNSETIETLFNRKNIRVERIISNGQASPDGFWYDQAEEEWVVLLKGLAVLEFENNQTLELAEGDYILIPAHTRHRVRSTCTDPGCVWLAVFIS